MAGLQRELASLEAKLSEAQVPKAGVIEELSAMRRELARGDERRVSLPLANVRVASPCKERWADMVGDERVRVCNGCERPVFNLSEMTRAEAEAVLAARGIKPCVRFYRRADGTVMTADCSTGARRSRRLAVVAAGTAMLSSPAAMAEPPATPAASDTPVDLAADPAADPAAVPVADPANSGLDVTMGELIVVPPQHPTVEWSTWVRAGYGVKSHAPNVATRSIVQPAPVVAGTGEAALGADVSVAVAGHGNVRLGAWGEVRTSSGPVLGGELLVHGLPPHPDVFRIDSGGLVLRGGGNAHVFTTAIGYGYVGTWSGRDDWTGRHYLVGVRLVASMTRSVDDARDWSATLGVELEPIAAVSYVVKRLF
jgi:hypothetical protein